MPAARKIGKRLASARARAWSISELAAIAQVSTRTVKRWIEAGLIQPRRRGKDPLTFAYPALATARLLGRQSKQCRGRRRVDTRQSMQLRIGSQRRPLALARVEAPGRLLWRDRRGRLIDTGGQFHFDFEEEFAPTLALPPRLTASDWFQQGLAAEDSGDFAAAITAYQAALELPGDHAAIYFNLGNVLIACGRCAEALACYDEALAREPHSIEAWNNRGAALAGLHRYEEACAAFRRAIRLQPAYADARHNLADALDLADQTRS